MDGQKLPASLLEQCEVVEEKSSPSQETEGKMVVVGRESSCVNIDDVDSVNHYGDCVICLNKIILEETALVKGCEHAYCVTCILRWASCKKDPKCPQCKNPFEFLNVHRSLDGSIHDYMFEESVCLLLRASWFMPLRNIEESVEVNEDMEMMEYQYQYMDEEDELDDEVYFGNSSSLRIGNRRWGDNGYVRAGRQEARPVHHPNNIQGSGGGGGAGPSRQSFVKKEAVSQGGGGGGGGRGGGEGSQANVGRRAKRAMKREAADKAAAAKHQQHLTRLGRK